MKETALRLSKQASNHQIKCYDMYGNILKGAELYLRFDDDFSETEIRENLYKNNTRYIRLSVLTKEMLDYDTEMFNIQDKEVLLKHYRPYFCSFIVPFEYNNVDIIISMRNEWCIGKFIDKNVLDDKNAFVLNGSLEIGASPVNYIDGNLLVFKNKAIKQTDIETIKNINRINKMYSIKKFVCTSDADVEKVLNEAWDKNRLRTIDIYNVGHGNCDYIRGIKKRILYDVGYNYRCFPTFKPKRFMKATNAIRKMKPSCVIISHWDMDHFIGCAYAEQSLFCVKWVAPYLTSKKDTDVNVNAIRLAYYLKIIGNLCLVKRDRLKPKLIATINCKNDLEMKVWMGSGKSHITYRNKEGLFIEVVEKNMNMPHVLLSGDVPYNCIPDDVIKGKMDFMHVPHHCSKMELDKLKRLLVEGKYAVISTNRRKKSKKMNYCKCHHSLLEDKFDNVIHTIDNKKGDEENLSIRYKYESNDCIFRE